MEKNSKIYVAGHRGLVGSAIVRRLQQEGYSNILQRTHKELDLTDRAAVDSFLAEEKPEYLFLAAARVGGILANDTYPADFIRDNLLIQTNVIDAAYKNGTKKLLFLGSSCIYPKNCPQPIKEEYLLTGPLEPTNDAYAVAKIAGIKMCQAYRRQYGFNAISVMPTNLYGPGDNFDLETSHVLPALIRKFHLAKLAMNGDLEGIRTDELRFGAVPEPLRSSLAQWTSEARSARHSSRSPLTARCSLPLWGTGRPRREFLHVDDLSDACSFLMRYYDSEEIINIGAGKDLTIRELAHLVAITVGFEGSLIFDSSKPDGTPQKLLDVSNIHRLGWTARIRLEEGIGMTYSWYADSIQELPNRA